MDVHLIGGGWDDDLAPTLYGPFVEAAARRADGTPRILLVVMGTDPESLEYHEKYVDTLGLVGGHDLVVERVAEGTPMEPAGPRRGRRPLRRRRPDAGVPRVARGRLPPDPRARVRRYAVCRLLRGCGDRGLPRGHRRLAPRRAARLPRGQQRGPRRRRRGQRHRPRAGSRRRARRPVGQRLTPRRRGRRGAGPERCRDRRGDAPAVGRCDGGRRARVARHAGHARGPAGRCVRARAAGQ